MPIDHSFYRIVHIDYLVKKDGSIYLNKLFLSKKEILGVKKHFFGKNFVEEIQAIVDKFKLESEEEKGSITKVYDISQMNRLRIMEKFKTGINYFDLSLGFKKDDLLSWLAKASERIVRKEIIINSRARTLKKADFIEDDENEGHRFKVDPENFGTPSILMDFIEPFKFKYQRKDRAGFIRQIAVVKFSPGSGLDVFYASPLAFLSDKDLSEEQKDNEIIVKSKTGLIQSAPKEQADLVKTMTRGIVLKLFKDLVGDDSITYSSERDLSKISITQKDAAAYQKEASKVKTMAEIVEGLKKKYAKRNQPRQIKVKTGAEEDPA